MQTKQATPFEKTKEALIQKFEQAQWGSIELNLKKSGHCIEITPVAQIQPDIKNLSDVEWFLVNGSPLMFLGGSSLDHITNNLLTYDEKLIALENDKTELKKMFDDLVQTKAENPEFKTYESNDYGVYSDWHKDLFGFRPNGLTFGKVVA